MATDMSSDYDSLLEFLYQAPIGLIQATGTGAIEMLNPVSARLLMLFSADGNLDNLFTLLEAAAPDLRRQVQSFPQPSGIVCESLRLELQHSVDSREKAQVVSLTMLKLDNGHLMAVIADATLQTRQEKEKLAHELAYVMHVDALTRMPNRAALEEQLGTMLSDAQNDPGHCAVLVLNCDRFRQINDAYGHAFSDQLLVKMAWRLRTTLNRSSRDSLWPGLITTLARLGSDEFAVVLKGIGEASDVDAIARHLMSILDQPYYLEGHQLACRVRVGAAVLTNEMQSAKHVLHSAGIALAAAKKNPAARYVRFTPELHQQAKYRSYMEAELRRALIEQELFVVYQPVVDLQSRAPILRCAGVEALVRWQHPLRGVVPPAEFIGIAEECDLINALGDFVLKTACRDFMTWQSMLGGLAPRWLAVNLSRAQLSTPGWLDKMRRILQSTGMPPNRLHFEVTESLAAQDETVQHALHELKALGLKLALDDFGTGYSSLACLHLLPLDIVKIDRSFVSQVDTSTHHRVLVEATVRVAHSLGMKTVAEGIETPAQAAAVIGTGCNKGQGYLYSPPLKPHDLAQWLFAGAMTGNLLTHAV